jgi:hypothetical protein
MRPAERSAAGVARAGDPALRARVEAAFGASAPAIRRFAWVAAAVMAVVYLSYLVQMIVAITAPGYGGESIAIDFVAFWAAAKLAVAGHAAAAFDPQTLQAAMALPANSPPGDLLWLYPPAWHMLIAPLGLMPFLPAYLVYSAVTFAAFAAAARPLAAPLPGGLPLALAAPALLVGLILGNNSLIWTAGLLGALGAMPAGRAALAGLLIACLTLKPQLGLLIPVALLAGRHWRVILWAVLGTAGIVLVSTAVMGLAYWTRFFSALSLMSGLLSTHLVNFDRMISWYALARLAGAPHAAAMAMQVVIGLAAAGAVGWVWSRPRAGADIRAAALCAAIPLATPYAYHYELTLALAAALFLARDGFGAVRGQRAWLLALWVVPALNLGFAGTLAPAVYAAPMMSATLALCAARVARLAAPATA